MAIYLIDGKPHRMCECAQFSEACPRGLKRTPQTAGYSRCCIPAPDVAMTTIALSETVAIPVDVARLIRKVFLPTNPNKCRTYHPDTLAAVRAFIAAVEGK